MSENKKEDENVEVTTIDTGIPTIDTGIMKEPQILPDDPKFMTPEKQILSGSPVDSDPHLFQITLVKWADFLRFIEPVRRNIVGSTPPTPNLPVFYNIHELSNEATITFMALGGFRKKTLLSYSFTEKMGRMMLSQKLMINKDEINQMIRTLEKKGYIVVAGEIDPYF